MERARRLVAALSLLALAASLSSSLRPADAVERVRRLARALSNDPTYRPEAMSFWFDADYAAFLEDVRRRTPETATVAVLVPERPDVYLYQALYRLAPRRVVDGLHTGEADAVATYRTELARGPGGVEIAGGRLWAR